MNESSSKFVDHFALEKLLTEKLSKVHHSPHDSFFHNEKYLFCGFENAGFDFTSGEAAFMQDEQSYQVLKIPSSIMEEPYPENRNIYLHFHRAASARGNILLVHGLYDDNLLNYVFLIQLLKESGFNVFLFILPYHYERKPALSLFSGEFYFSADLSRSQHAAKQAIFDLKTAIGVVKQTVKLPTMIAGYSMGGCISLRYFMLEKDPDILFLINPVTRLSQLIWESPLLSPVHNDLETAGYSLEQAQTFFQMLDPVRNIGPNLPVEKIAIGYSFYDQIVDEMKYLQFIEEFQFQTIFHYHAGHLNVLRVPKLSSDMINFFETMVRYQ